MKNKLIIISMLLAFITGLSINNFAMSAIPSNFKFAVVDVNDVVSKSPQVKALRTENAQKIEELQKWLQTVRAEVNKQSTKAGKEKLIKQYDAQFAKKQEAIRNNYAAKLKAIDKSISATIAREAREGGYNLVLAKGAVLYGGDDITAAISKKVK